MVDTGPAGRHPHGFTRAGLNLDHVGPCDAARRACRVAAVVQMSRSNFPCECARAQARAFNPFMCGARPSCTKRHRSLDSRVRLGDGVSPECSNESSSCVVVVGVERTLLGHLAGRRGPVDEHRQVEDFDPGEGASGGDGRHAAGRSCTVLTGSVEGAARSRPGGQAADCSCVAKLCLLFFF